MKFGRSREETEMTGYLGCYSPSDGDRRQLAAAVKSVPARFGNVDVAGKPDRMTYSGSSYLATTLHAAAVLLEIDCG